MVAYYLNFSLFFILSAVVLFLPIPTAKAGAALLLRAHEGRGTWYQPGDGNCGWNNSKDEYVVAIGKELYDRNKGSNCGQWVEIYNTKNGNKADGYIVDSCTSCSDDDLDMSPALFQQLDDLSTGVIQISWDFLPN